MVQFRLLGDVQADLDGRLIDLGHARQRCVLVALLADANRAVSPDELVDRVWGQQVPRRAHGALYVYVSRLRQVLAVSDTVRIVRQPTGYRLTIDPLTVDLHQFQQLIGRAGAAGTAAEALELLEQALALWRGDAFATLDTPWLATVREDLHRRRLAAELDRNDLALGQGQHTKLLAALTTSAVRHPLDERLAGQLMLALYRSGRQADALAHYQQLRQQLANELGADPSATLQHLHQQILTTDPALAAPITPTQRAEQPTIPRQLPAPPRSFAGRADELARLDALLSTADRAHSNAVVIATLSGTAGIGKTALALHWAHQVKDRFPGGQLYINLRGFDPSRAAMDPGVAVRGFLDALGVAPQRIPTDFDAQAALYRSQLAGRRVLVLLDNARDTTQVRPLLPGTPDCLALVTSRNQLTGLIATDGARPITLDVLTPAEAHDLLASRLGPDRVAAEPDAVGEIVTRCARLPLALTIVAARAAAHPRRPLQVLAGELRDVGGLDVLTTDDPTTNVRAVFSWSYEALSPDAARLFRLLGLHPGPDISVPAAASLAGVPAARVRPLLTELTEANLLVEHTPGRYTFHDLLRAYASGLAHLQQADHQQRHTATHRILDHYLHTAHAADRLLFPGRDPITPAPPRCGVTPEHFADHHQALAWFTAEYPALLAAVDHAAASGFDTHTWQLAWTLWTFLDRRGHWHDWIATERAALAAARRLADPIAQAHTHRNLAAAYTKLGRFDEARAHVQRALDLTDQAGDLVGQAHTHHYLAYLRGRQGHHAEALNGTEQALELFRAAGHKRGQADTLNAVGWFHAQLGNYHQALTACLQALELHRDLDDRPGQADTWDSIGYAYHHLGLHTEAVTSYQHALNLYRDLSDRHGEADSLVHLGDTHHVAGNPHAAHTAYQHAVTILDQLHHPDGDHVRTKLATFDIPTNNYNCG